MSERVVRRVLVTNDDGIDSEGIHVLARALAAAGHEVIVVAPDGEQSGTGAALGHLSPDTPLPVRRVQIEGPDAIEAWALAGPPALTVVAGRLGAFGPPPDLVVSGINAGLNTGRAVLHSGTVGAALAAQNFGLSGLAVSIDVSDPWHWDTAADFAVEALDLLVDAPPRSVLNLNVPALPRAEVHGMRWARLAPFGSVRTAVSPMAGDALQFEFRLHDYEPDPDTDQGSVRAGWAALTTIVGVVEAWPLDEDGAPDADSQFSPRVVPGASLHPLHRVPDASDHRLLRRGATAT